MATADYHAHPYIRGLNDWHLQLGIAADALKFSVDQLEDIPEGLLNVLGILSDRVTHLVETCPFPQEDQIVAPASVGQNPATAYPA